MRFSHAAVSAFGWVFFTLPLPDGVRAETGNAPGTQALRLLNEGLVGVYEKVAPSVVVIEVGRKQAVPEGIPEGFEFFFRDPGAGDSKTPLPRPAPESEGSGFIIREDGYILTNHHVVANAESLTVKLKSGSVFPATLVGSDDKTDLAVIKIEAKELPAAELGDSDNLRVGQIVCAIGTPYNLDYTLTMGVVSALSRSNLQQALYEEYIQTDTSINPGNSGGPLCDIEGRVIGVNTLINGINRGLAFAIPINMARGIGDQLISTGHIVRPWLGIRIRSLTERLVEEPSLKNHFVGIDRGVVVETIEPDTPAYKSRLRPADVITKVDGTFVATARDLQKEILKKKIGQEVELSVWRNGKTERVTIKTGELPTELSRTARPRDPEPRDPSEPEAPESALFGLQLQDLTAGIAENLGLAVKSGVLVTDVTTESPAQVAGLEPRDVITEADAKPVRSVDEFRQILKKSDPARGLLLFVDRQGDKTYAVLKAK